MPATKLTLQATSFKRMQLNDNDELTISLALSALGLVSVEVVAM